MVRMRSDIRKERLEELGKKKSVERVKKIRKVDEEESKVKTVRFYTVEEDAKIIRFVKEKNGEMSQVALAGELGALLKRTPESVRDRIKRYLSKLSAADTNKILDTAETSPNHFVYFKGNKKRKQVEKIVEEEPNFQIRAGAVKAKKVGKPGGGKKEKKGFDWILKKIQATDPYFALAHSVHLLNAVFGELMEQGVSRKDIENFIKNTDGEVTLSKILGELAYAEE